MVICVVSVAIVVVIGLLVVVVVVVFVPLLCCYCCSSNGTAHFKNVNNCLNTNIYSYLRPSGGSKL